MKVTDFNYFIKIVSQSLQANLDQNFSLDELTVRLRLSLLLFLFWFSAALVVMKSDMVPLSNISWGNANMAVIARKWITVTQCLGACLHLKTCQLHWAANGRQDTANAKHTEPQQLLMEMQADGTMKGQSPHFSTRGTMSRDQVMWKERAREGERFITSSDCPLLAPM